MGTILTEIEDNEFRYDKRLHVKGAAEIVLSTCSHYLDKDGVRRELSNDFKNKIISDVIEEFARGALRTICLAYKDLKESEGGLTHEDDHEDTVNKVVEKFGLTWIGILGIRDIIRPEVPKAVQQCQTAGIKVRMVTGDNKVTALAIAKQCGIVGTNHPDAVMEGPQFYERIGGLYWDIWKEDSPCKCKSEDTVEKVKNFEAFKSVWKNLDVLARSRPEDKYLLVTGLKQMGDIVAVTGDGTNDAPALKKADVGFAMGITGTDVAKHAAAIILLDDNFASIVRACMWGRNIYDNIRRFLQFQLTVNVNALLIAFVGSWILRESPLQPIQLLWVNLIMDSLASLALATEYPKENLLERPPYAKDEYIISRKMMKHIIWMSIFQAIILFVVIFAGDSFVPEDEGYWPRNGKFVQTGREYDWNGNDLYKKYNEKGNDVGPSRHMTVVFNIFVLMQIAHMLCWRKIDDSFNIFEGVFSNVSFLIIFISITVIQVIIVQFTQDVFKVARKGLYWGQWLFCFAVLFAVFPVDALIKLIPDKLFCDLTKKKKKDHDDIGGMEETKIEKGKDKENGENVLRERSSGENHPLNSNEEA